jgi:hypothetical protein
MNEINKKSQSRYARCPEVRYRYCLENRACVSLKIVKHRLRSCLHLLLFVRFVQHVKISVENKRLKSIKNEDIPDVRMAAKQVWSSLFPAKSRLCWC